LLPGPAAGVQKFSWTGVNSYFTKADETGLCFGAGRLAGCDIFTYLFFIPHNNYNNSLSDEV